MAVEEKAEEQTHLKCSIGLRLKPVLTGSTEQANGSLSL